MSLEASMFRNAKSLNALPSSSSSSSSNRNKAERTTRRAKELNGSGSKIGTKNGIETSRSSRTSRSTGGLKKSASRVSFNDSTLVKTIEVVSSTSPQQPPSTSSSSSPEDDFDNNNNNNYNNNNRNATWYTQDDLKDFRKQWNGKKLEGIGMGGVQSNIRKDVIRSILQTQSEHKKMGISDPKGLRQLSRACSKKAIANAIERAQQEILNDY